MIKIIFLGTGQAIPTAKRNHTAVLLRYKNENILVDCGEGTQRQFRIARINPCKLTRLLITHWHGDHILGIPGLFQTLALNNYNKKLRVYGSKRTKSFLDLIMRMFVFTGKLKTEIKEIGADVNKSKAVVKFFENDYFYLEAASMKHGAPCNAYSFVEKDRVRVDKRKMQKYGLKSSPLMKKIKQGKNILHKGKRIKAKDLIYKEKGKKIAFIFDTAINDNAIKIAKNADLLICESTYINKEKEKAKEYKHLTACQAAQIAKKAKVKKLILTHLSQRYEKKKKEQELFREAKKIFKNAQIAHDFMKIEV